MVAQGEGGPSSTSPPCTSTSPLARVLRLLRRQGGLGTARPGHGARARRAPHHRHLGGSGRDRHADDRPRGRDPGSRATADPLGLPPTPRFPRRSASSRPRRRLRDRDLLRGRRRPAADGRRRQPGSLLRRAVARAYAAGRGRRTRTQMSSRIGLSAQSSTRRWTPRTTSSAGRSSSWASIPMKPCSPSGRPARSTSTVPSV